MERATFAVGSFERVEETFRRLEGVQQTMVGYAGGQEATAHASKERLRQSARFTRPIVTEIVPATRFYYAEKYHQPHIARQGDAVSLG